MEVKFDFDISLLSLIVVGLTPKKRENVNREHEDIIRQTAFHKQQRKQQ